MARRFHFRLETLLRVRLTQEREAKRRLGEKQAELARLDQLDRATLHEIHTRQDELARTQENTRADVHELTRQRAWIAHLRRSMAERGLVRRTLTEELEQLRTALLEARTRARVIEKLRERRWSEHRATEARAEQSAAEELAQHMHAFRSIGFADERELGITGGHDGQAV